MMLSKSGEQDALGTDHTASDAQADVFRGVHSEALHAFRKATKDTLRVRPIPRGPSASIVVPFAAKPV